jgi:hypothetical protein
MRGIKNMQNDKDTKKVNDYIKENYTHVGKWHLNH